LKLIKEDEIFGEMISKDNNKRTTDAISIGESHFLTIKK
jgi:hypothetical protein